ncbi:hypothetical protein K474DRAFT_1690765 [Panus rudis PR-1116 ss-1]|nr:hypothetical protein K474DRAFT_1690765 [Panus rudis PR-1116 ss-1]
MLAVVAMSLRYVRSTLSGDNVLSAAIATTSITKELADMMQFPPARAAASILLMIFTTIQSMQSNRNDCYRLARRCLSLLVDVKTQMEGRWENAPPSLLKNIARFERTLESIHTFMTEEAQQKWHDRLFRNGTIEEAIKSFNTQLDDAARSFQICTLISIHHSLGDLPTPSEQRIYSMEESFDMTNVNNKADLVSSSIATQPVLEGPRDSRVQDALFDSVSIRTLVEGAVPAASIQCDIDHRGFRRYHQSEIRLRKRRKGSASDFWGSTSKVEVNGQQHMLKQYDGPRAQATMRWMRDVKILQNLYHPNLPQMVGYSDDESPTPFILLANVQTRLPQALVLDLVRNASLAVCAKTILRFYRDTLDAALYMQRQLNLSNEKLQDYVESATYRIDEENTVVMGLPPQSVDNVVSFRNFGLGYSIRKLYTQILPNKGYAAQPQDPDSRELLEVQHKVAHLTVLANALLPEDDDPEHLSSRLNELALDDEDDDKGTMLTLRQIRTAAIETNHHDHVWRPKSVPPHKLSVGDVGYLPPASDFDSFVVLRNIIGDVQDQLQISRSATGWQAAWEGGFRQRNEVQSFEFPGNVYGWPIVVPVGTQQDLQVVHEDHFTSTGSAWHYLLTHGKQIAADHGVKAEELILITRAGVDQQYSARDFRQMPYMHQHHMQMSRQPAHAFGHPAFTSHNRLGFGASAGGQSRHHTPMHHFPHEQMLPTILYLFSSPAKEHIPYWSDKPFYQPLRSDEEPPQFRNMRTNIGWTYGFINYVQLHAEDFE